MVLGRHCVVLLLFLVCFIAEIATSGYSNGHQHRCSTLCQHGNGDSQRVTGNRCRQPSPPSPGFISCSYDDTKMKCIGTCTSGYIFPTGRTQIELECSMDVGAWYPLATFPNCQQKTHDMYSEREQTQQRENNKELSDTVRRCKRPTPPANGGYSCTYDDEHMLCTGRCNSGYYFPNGQSSIEMKCLTERAYWYPFSQFPDCSKAESERYVGNEQQQQSGDRLSLTRSRCRRPSPPTPGRINCDYNETTMICTGTCDYGYHFPDGNREMVLQCNTRDAYWYPQQTFPDCTVASVTLTRCRKPKPPTDGYFTCIYDDNHMLCTGTCNTGFYFPNGKTEMELECKTHTAYWHPFNDFPDCSKTNRPRYRENEELQRREDQTDLLSLTKSRCPQPAPPIPGRVDCNYDETKMTCTGKCASGYYFPDGTTEMILQCNTRDAYFYPREKFPNCVSLSDRERYRENEEHQQKQDQTDLLSITKQRCPRPPAPTSGRIECNYNTTTMICRGTCYSGYYFPDRTTEMILQCNTRDAYWYPRNTFPDCASRTDRYRENEEHQRREDQTDLLTITKQRCLRPPAPTSGRIECNYNTTTMICRGTCYSGYYFPDRTTEMILQCNTRDAYWYPRNTFPDCSSQTDRHRENEEHQRREDQTDLLTITKQRCPRPPAPTSGRIECNYNTTTMICRGTCYSGYYFPDRTTEMILQCNTRDAYWYPRNTFPDCASRTDRYRENEEHQRRQDQTELLTIIKRRCPQPHRPISGQINCSYNETIMICIGTCATDYYFPDGSREMIMQCNVRDAYWYPRDKFPECTSFTDRHRENEDQQRRQDQTDLLSITRSRCLKPHPPTPGRISCDYNETKMICTGTCSLGYYFPDGTAEMILQCNTRDAYWYPKERFPKCTSLTDAERYKENEEHQRKQNQTDLLSITKSRCPQPPTPKPGRIDCSYNETKMVCTGTCASGYYFPDGSREIILQCNTRDAYWYPRETFPSCSSVSVTKERCQRPPTPAPGRISCKYNSTKMICTGTCASGYYFPDGSTEMILQCNTRDAYWYPRETFPNCTSLTGGISTTLTRCKRPVAPAYGYYRCKYDSEHILCTGTCESGYYFPNGRSEMQMECKTRNAVWYPSKEFPDCERPRDSENDEKVYDKTTLLTVRRSRCERPRSPLFGQIHCTYTQSKSTCLGTCNPGYYYPDGTTEMELQCTIRDGYWYPQQSFPNCSAMTAETLRKLQTEELIQERLHRLELLALTRSKCQRPAAPIPGQINCNYDESKMICTGVCESGYYFPDGSTEKILKCNTKDAYWYPKENFPVCSAVSEQDRDVETSPSQRQEERSHLKLTLRKCRKPSAPVSGYINCKYDRFGHNCTGTCNTGYYFPNGKRQMVLKCITEDSFWKPHATFPRCIELEELRGGDLEQTSVQEKDNEDSLSVILRKCERRSSPLLGRTSCTHDSTSMKCTGTCYSGYNFPDGNTEMILQCNENGNWHPFAKFPDCSLKTRSCGKPLSPVFGYFSCSRHRTTLTCLGRCNPGYHFPNGRTEMELRCTHENGYWYPSEKFPDCRNIDTEDENSRVDIHSEDRHSTGNDNDHLEQTVQSEKLEEDNDGISDNCEEKPQPPDGGYLSCVNYPREIECTGTCLPGYAFLNGNTAMVLKCPLKTGRWTPHHYFPSCFLKEVSTSRSDRLEVTEKEDKNEVICAKPLTPKGGYIHCEGESPSGFRKCTGTCMSGYTFPNGLDAMVLRCSYIRGWVPVPSFPACSIEEATASTVLEPVYIHTPTPPISQKVEDERLHIEQSRIREDEDKETSHTDIDSRRDSTDHTSDRHVIVQPGSRPEGLNVCRQPPPPKSGYFYCLQKSEFTECTAKCLSGYEFPSKERKLINICENKSGRWSPRGYFPECKPVCDVPCKNGGVCVRPNQCLCSQDYRGNFCQYPLSNCDPHMLQFAGNIRCNHTTEETVCRLGCPQGMVLDQPVYETAKCSLNGIWTPRRTPRCIEDGTSDVQIKEHQCGDAPCSSTLDDRGLCHRPSPPRPGSIRCVYNQLMMECISKCAEGYKFPDGRTEQIRTCDNRTGIWTPRQEFKDCKPTCERSCYNGGECLAPNFCFCPIKFRGNQCQYPLSNCDPHGLRFAGSIRCNHTSEETVCYLGCPEGTVLNRPEAKVVRCTLSGVWSPRLIPRCVEDNAVRRTTESDSHRRHNFEQSYHQKETTETAHNNYEHRYEQRQTDVEKRLSYEEQLRRNQTENTEQRRYEDYRQMQNYNQQHRQKENMNYQQQNRQTDKLTQENYEQHRQSDNLNYEQRENTNKEDYQNLFRGDHLDQQRLELDKREDLESQKFHDMRTTSGTTTNDHSRHQIRQSEMGGYGNHYYHQRENQSETGSYREQTSKHQHHYFHRRTERLSSDKHDCKMC